MNGNLFDSLAEPVGWYTAWCDGGSRGNPGPAGYGAVIQNPQGETVARLSRFLGIQTNNFAEYQGLLAVLEWSVQNGAKRLRVISDSELMVNQMKGRYKVASPTLRPLFEQAKLLSKSLEKFEMQHTLRGGNKEADRLANEAMDKGQGTREQAIPASKDSSPGTPAGNKGTSTAGTPPVSRPGRPDAPQAPRQVIEGFVKNGVVHPIEGELPDGIIVKIIRE
jgi:ribonuclease HI